jgi:hypothetical protein
MFPWSRRLGPGFHLLADPLLDEGESRHARQRQHRQSDSDESWKPVVNALAEYGEGVMKGWLFTGRIYSEVAGGGSSPVDAPGGVRLLGVGWPG